MRRATRGAILITVMLILMVLVMMVVALVLRLRGSSFANRGGLDEQRAVLAAQSGLAESLSHLTEDRGWSTDLHVSLPNGRAAYDLTFGPSVNNLEGASPLDGPQGPGSVLPGSAYLVIVGRAGTRTRTLEAVVTPRSLLPSLGAAMLNTGRIDLEGKVLVTGQMSFTDSHSINADLFSLSRTDSSGLVTWTPDSPTDTARIKGNVKIVSANPAAIQMGAAVVSGNPNSYGESPIPPPQVDIPGRIASARPTAAIPALTPGVTRLPPGDYYIDGDLVYDGDLDLDGANLYVSGKVDLNGTLKGRGSVFVGQSTTFHGDSDITASNADNVALFSKGNIQLLGFDGTRYLQNLAASSGNDANGNPYTLDLSNTQAGLTELQENLTNYVRTGDTGLFGTQNSFFDKISNRMGHVHAPGSTALAFTSIPSQQAPMLQLHGLVAAQPGGPTRDFVQKRLEALYDPAERGLFGYTGGRPGVTQRFLEQGDIDGVADIINDQDQNPIYPNPYWTGLTAAQKSQIYARLSSVLGQVSFDRLGAARFNGVLYTNGSIYSAQEVTIQGQVIAVDDGTQTDEVIGGRTLHAGDVFLDSGTHLNYVKEVADTAGLSQAILGASVWIWK